MTKPGNLLPSDTYCRDCGAMWTASSRICHCVKCHATFTDEDAFTAHQRLADEGGRVVTHCHTTPLSLGRIDADGFGRYRTASNGTEALRAYRERKKQSGVLTTAEGVERLKQLMEGE